jgi:hypothetical protein
MHPVLIATAFANRCDSGELLHLPGAGEPLAVAAKSRQEPRSECLTRPWERVEDRKIGMPLDDLLNSLFPFCGWSPAALR